MVTQRPDRPLSRNYAQGIWFQLIVFAIGFLIVFSRRPDALLNAQFFAEDGSIFYRDAYQLGLHSLLLTYGGYFHTLLRLTAVLARAFPFAWAPLILNLVGITIQVLPVNVFASSRFSYISPPIRLLAGLVYLGLPNSFEIHVTATNLQWHQALLACLLLLAEPAKTLGWRVFDAITLVLACLSSPMGILLLPVAALVWWNRGYSWSAASFGFLLPGTAIQTISVLLNWRGRQVAHVNFAGQVVFDGGRNGVNFHDFAAIFGRQVFFSSLFGLSTQNLLTNLHGLFALEIICTGVGFAFLLYALRHAPMELRIFILFAFAVLTLDLINPLAGTPDHTQWYWLSRPGCGNRYYFLPMLAFLASLFWAATRKASLSLVRSVALALLLLLPFGIYSDWRLTPLEDFRFSAFVSKFNSVPSGTRVVIPINPGWLMELTKH
jgi:hypothetical protein